MVGIKRDNVDLSYGASFTALIALRKEITQIKKNMKIDKHFGLAPILVINEQKQFK